MSYRDIVPEVRCKYCGEECQDCDCLKLRLLLKNTVSSSDARIAEILYKTVVVWISPDDEMIKAIKNLGNYEVIGGEWIKREDRG